MPKRTTLNFSSESAPPTADGEKLYVYYCKHSSRHVLTSDVDLQRAPRRCYSWGWNPESRGVFRAHAPRVSHGDSSVLSVRPGCCLILILGEIQRV